MIMIMQGEVGTTSSFMAPVFQFDQLLKWTSDKCIPLVREITFQNAEVTLMVKFIAHGKIPGCDWFKSRHVTFTYAHYAVSEQKLEFSKYSCNPGSISTTSGTKMHHIITT